MKHNAASTATTTHACPLATAPHRDQHNHTKHARTRATKHGNQHDINTVFQIACRAACHRDQNDRSLRHTAEVYDVVVVAWQEPSTYS
eukprot:COSAG02_NODE_131_length_34710_cov_17.171159_23_plen_88_part_00